MTVTSSVEALRVAGSGVAAPEGVVALYQRAFEEFAELSLWNRHRSEHPTITQVLVIAEALRTEGNLKSRTLAEEIEEACRAAV